MLIDIAKVELIRDALQKQTVCHMGANMALTDYADFSGLIHKCFLSGRFAVTGVFGIVRFNCAGGAKRTEQAQCVTVRCCIIVVSVQR